VNQIYSVQPRQNKIGDYQIKGFIGEYFGSRSKYLQRFGPVSCFGYLVTLGS
jgi:hypothetical protein